MPERDIVKRPKLATGTCVVLNSEGNPKFKPRRHHSDLDLLDRKPLGKQLRVRYQDAKVGKKTGSEAIAEIDKGKFEQW